MIIIYPLLPTLALHSQHGVTQSKINTAGMTSFVWMSPEIGQQEEFQMW